MPDGVPGQPRAADPEWHVQRATKEKALKKIIQGFPISLARFGFGLIGFLLQLWIW